MKKLILIILSVALFIQASAQKDTLTFHKHTFGIDILRLSSSLLFAPFNDFTYFNTDMFYRYQLSPHWGINSGFAYRGIDRNMSSRNRERIITHSFGFRIGGVYGTKGFGQHKETSLTFGINAFKSFINEDVHFNIVSSTWGSYPMNYAIYRERHGAEIEIGVDHGFSKYFGARVAVRGGYSPVRTDRDNRKGEYFAGIHNWIISDDIYFYASYFIFIRAQKNVRIR